MKISLSPLAVSSNARAPRHSTRRGDLSCAYRAPRVVLSWEPPQPVRCPRESDSHYESRVGQLTQPYANTGEAPDSQPEKLLAEWGCDDALMVGIPMGAKRDLMRFATTGKEELAKNRIRTMKEIAEIAGMAPGATWEKSSWDKGVSAWEAAEAERLALAKQAARRRGRRRRKAAREAAAAASK